MSDTTKLTEIVTGLGMLGGDHPAHMLPARPGELRNVDEPTWAAIVDAWHQPQYRGLVDAAFENGRSFYDSADGLRGRRPRLVEWTGPRRSPGDEVAPVDLRVDHVYLVSCKYLSKITMNASPSHLFERLLTGGHGQRASDWYQQVANDEYRALRDASRRWAAEFGDHGDATPIDSTAGARLSRDQRRAFSAQLRAPGGGWPDALKEPYDALCAAVAVRSALTWNAALRTNGPRSAEAMLWRLLRIGSAPYFVLGTTSGANEALRLRVASPWDWRQHFRLKGLDISALPGGQPMVGWEATFVELGAGNGSDRGSEPRSRNGRTGTVKGHVEIRWSHGRFNGPPEAKVYLDTPFDQVPGYWPIA